MRKAIPTPVSRAARPITHLYLDPNFLNTHLTIALPPRPVHKPARLKPC